MARTKGFNQDEVLDKILGLFCEKGYHQAKLDDILQCAGISKQSMYDTYGDKRTLFLKALRLYCDRNIDMMKQKVEREIVSGTSYLQILQDLIIPQTMSDCNCNGGLITSSMVEFKEDNEDVFEIIHQMQSHLEQISFDIVKNGQNSGEITSDFSAEEITYVLLYCRNGIHVAFQHDAPNDIYCKVVNTLVSLLKTR